MKPQLTVLALLLAPACTNTANYRDGLAPGQLDQVAGTYAFVLGGGGERHRIRERNGGLQVTTSEWIPTWGEWQADKERINLQFSHVTRVDELRLGSKDVEAVIEAVVVHSYSPASDATSLGEAKRFVFFVDPRDGKTKLALGAEEEGLPIRRDDHLASCSYNGPFVLEEDLVLPKGSWSDAVYPDAGVPLEEGNAEQIAGQYIVTEDGEPRSKFDVVPAGDWITFKESSWKDGAWKPSTKDLGQFKFSHAAVVDKLTLSHGPYQDELLEGAVVHSYFPDLENMKQQLPWRILFVKHPRTGARYLTIQFEPMGAAFKVRTEVRRASLRRLFRAAED
jgi:hypothetical protein